MPGLGGGLRLVVVLAPVGDDAERGDVAVELGKEAAWGPGRQGLQEQVDFLDQAARREEEEEEARAEAEVAAIRDEEWTP